MSVTEALKSAQFVVNDEGSRTGVLLNIQAWNTLINWIEEMVDSRIAAQALTELQAAGGRPQQAGWLAWDDISSEWDDD